MTFSNAGHQDIRTYLKNNWNWIAVVADNGSEQLRWDTLNNGNVTIISDETNNPVTVELEITGADVSGNLPVTLTKTEAYKGSGTSSSMGSDTMTNATLEANGDTVTITHNYEHPPQ